MSDLEIVQFIKTTLVKRGEGTDSDPVRMITQYWDFNGRVVFEIDPCDKKNPVKYYQ